MSGGLDALIAAQALFTVTFLVATGVAYVTGVSAAEAVAVVALAMSSAALVWIWGRE